MGRSLHPPPKQKYDCMIPATVYSYVPRSRPRRTLLRGISTRFSILLLSLECYCWTSRHSLRLKTFLFFASNIDNFWASTKQRRTILSLT
jgi:hypothetical protein